MNAETKTLLDMLVRDDLDAFLAGYERYRLSDEFQAYCMYQIQAALSTVVRRRFRASKVTGKVLAKLYTLAEHRQLLPIDDDVRALVIRRVDEALGVAEPESTMEAQPGWASIGRPIRNSNAHKERTKVDATQHRSQMKRETSGNAIAILALPASGEFKCSRNLCDSSQEKEFLRAIRLYFPALFAYPNVTLRCFINLDEIGAAVPDRLRHYSQSSRVDVLLCTHDEEPVAGFELDSAWHDGSDAKLRDGMKNELFHLAGLPLVRIRAANPGKVRAEDFYELLIAEQGLNLIRPERMHPSRKHHGAMPVCNAKRGPSNTI